jgi:hypothetical protein
MVERAPASPSTKRRRRCKKATAIDRRHRRRLCRAAIGGTGGLADGAMTSSPAEAGFLREIVMMLQSCRFYRCQRNNGYACFQCLLWQTRSDCLSSFSTFAGVSLHLIQWPASTTQCNANCKCAQLDIGEREARENAAISVNFGAALGKPSERARAPYALRDLYENSTPLAHPLDLSCSW